jgi:hypothetical protein
VVPLAGLEAARMLLRGILRLTGSSNDDYRKIAKNCKNWAFLSQKQSKTNKN